MPTPTHLEKFILLSVQLCGISSFDLVGTGYAGKFFETTESKVGTGLLTELLDEFMALAAGPGYNEVLKERIRDEPRFKWAVGCIMKLWYSAVWDEKEIPYPYAYPESLLGPAVGAHPAGAKPTGHQSWTLPPECLPIPPECV